MTTLERQKSILDEALAPHLTSEEGQAFLAGQARLDEVQVYCAPVNLPNSLFLQVEAYLLTLGSNGLTLPLLLFLTPHPLKCKAQIPEKQRYQSPSVHKAKHTRHNTDSTVPFLPFRGRGVESFNAAIHVGTGFGARIAITPPYPHLRA